MYPACIVDKFQELFGSAPQVTVRAPGRINLIGEHTDYNDGFVLPASIDKAIYFAAATRPDTLVEVFAYDLGESLTFSIDALDKIPNHWSNYLKGVVDELQKAGLSFGGLNLVFGGDIPLGAGVSSSAAVETGLAFVINHLYALGLDTMTMVKTAKAAENHFVGVNCGIMDQFASMFGKKDHVIRLDCRDLSYAYFPIALPEHTVILCNTGVKHSLGDSEYNTRRLECEEALRMLAQNFPSIKSWRDVSFEQLDAIKSQLSDNVYRRALYVIGEIERVIVACEALDAHDLATFGQKMNETHQGLQHNYEVSCPELDFLAARAIENPAVIGARMMGGGFGGCTINIVEKAAAADFLSSMKEAYNTAFQKALVCYEVALTNGTESIA